MERGMIHIYCGDGKGKTTAATGLAIRAAGCGNHVLFARFLKNENSGELRILDSIPEIEVLHLPKAFGFYHTLSPDDKEEMKAMYYGLWNTIQKHLAEGNYQMLIMDELMAAYRYGVVPCDEIIQFLKEKPSGLEVVMTGREPAEELTELADYISEIQKVKHPFDRGIAARQGVEY